MKITSTIRIALLTALFTAAYAASPQQPVPVHTGGTGASTAEQSRDALKQPTVADLQLTIAQLNVTIEQQKQQILDLQRMLLDAYKKDSDGSLAAAQQRLAAAQDAAKPKEQPKK